ncbi:MAG: AI-2E family transporter [Chloroflexota bacterium]|nr:AI-2E family transporter [Chloroflexota bacterium]
MPELTPCAQRRLRLSLSVLLAFALAVVVWQLFSILLPFLISAVMAYLLLPLVKQGDRVPLAQRWPGGVRAATAGFATLAVIVAVVVVLALGVFRLVDGSITLAERAPSIIAEGRAVWEELQEVYRNRVPANIQEIVDPRLNELQSALLNASLAALQRVSRVAQSGISQVVSLAASPIILFYLLYQPATLGSGTRRLLPGPLREDLSEIGRLAGESIGAYIRMQLLLGVSVGVVVWLALLVMGVPLALPLGILAGMAELVPIVGATIFIILASIVVALLDYTKLPFLIAVYLVVQILQNTLIAPRMQGQALGLHPLAVILALAIFGLFFGFLGTLLAAPLTAAGYRVLDYVRREWTIAGIVRLDDDSLAAVEMEEPSDPGAA